MAKCTVMDMTSGNRFDFASEKRAELFLISRGNELVRRYRQEFPGNKFEFKAQAKYDEQTVYSSIMNGEEHQPEFILKTK